MGRVSHLRRSQVGGICSPALTRWAKVWRAAGATKAAAGLPHSKTEMVTHGRRYTADGHGMPCPYKEKTEREKRKADEGATRWRGLSHLESRRAQTVTPMVVRRGWNQLFAFPAPAGTKITRSAQREIWSRESYTL